MPRLSYGKRTAIRQALDLQKLCVRACQLLDQDIQECESREERARIAGALGNVARNWTAIQDTVRVLKGDPLPGSFRPEKPKPRRDGPSGRRTLDPEAIAEQMRRGATGNDGQDG